MKKPSSLSSKAFSTLRPLIMGAALSIPHTPSLVDEPKGVADTYNALIAETLEESFPVQAKPNVSDESSEVTPQVEAPKTELDQASNLSSNDRIVLLLAAWLGLFLGLNIHAILSALSELKESLVKKLQEKQKAEIDVSSNEITWTAGKILEVEQEIERWGARPGTPEREKAIEELIVRRQQLESRLEAFRSLMKLQVTLQVALNPEHVASKIADLDQRIGRLMDLHCIGQTPYSVQVRERLRSYVTDLERIQKIAQRSPQDAFIGILQLDENLSLFEKTLRSEAEPRTVKLWADYIQDNRVDLQMLDENSMLIDFFELLGLERNQSWSVDFSNRARKAFRGKAPSYHPDRNNEDNNRFLVLNHAKQTFTDKEAFDRYLRFLNAFEKIFKDPTPQSSL